MVTGTAVEDVVATSSGYWHGSTEDFRAYFVTQTPEMLQRYERYVAPAAALVDQAAGERIGVNWQLSPHSAPPYAGPMLVVAGAARLDGGLRRRG